MIARLSKFPSWPVPGTDFTFAGRVISLDLHIGLLVLQSATDHKTYEIYLDPSAIAIDDRLTGRSRCEHGG